MTMIKLFPLLCMLLLSRCASTPPTGKEGDPELQIVYTVDKEGLFLYDLKSGETKKIYNSGQVFLENQFECMNDSTIILGYQGPSREAEVKRPVYSKYFYEADGDSSFVTDHPPYWLTDKHVYLTETFFAVNLNKGSSYTYKTLDYEHIDFKTLNLKTSVFDDAGNVIRMPDTSFLCSQTTGSYRGISFCDNESYLSQSAPVNGKQAFTRRGDLYLVNQKDTALLLKFDGHFDPKFGSGYYTPTLSPDGTKIAFKYLAGFLKSGSAVFEMNLQTKEKTKLAGEDYFDPLYSSDGKKLLLAKDREQSENKAWINSMYVLDIASGKLKKIGEGSNYRWRTKK